MPEVIVEKQLSEIWRRQNIRPAGLATEDGMPVTVIYPGRMNDNRGGDFCDAVILVGSRKFTGDVELHVKSGDWTGHRHHRDARYNGVVLHVVWRSNDSSTILENGNKIPVLALHEHVTTAVPEAIGATGPLSERWHRSCLKAGVGKGEQLSALLDQLGDARFRANVERYSCQMAISEPGQVLFEGIMTALGYAKNTAPFRELARRLPLCTLEIILSSMKDESESGCAIQLQDIMLRVGGFVPNDCKNVRAETNLESACIVLSRGRESTPENIRAMSLSEWNLYKVRPNNSPVVRIGAMSRLLSRYREVGIRAGFLDAVRQAPDRPRGYLRQVISVSGVGQQRIDEIITNVLLPFAWAFGRVHSERRLCRTAQELYRGQGRLATNCLEKHMLSQLGIERQLVNSARRQQGLIHVFRARCSQGRCGGCPLTKPKTGDDIDAKAIHLSR